MSHNNLIPGPMCTGSAHGAGAPGEGRAIHFPLPNRGGGTELATQKARLGGNWFSFLGALLPLYFLSSALLHGCAQAGGADLAPCWEPEGGVKGAFAHTSPFQSPLLSLPGTGSRSWPLGKWVFQKKLPASWGYLWVTELKMMTVLSLVRQQDDETSSRITYLDKCISDQFVLSGNCSPLFSLLCGVEPKVQFYYSCWEASLSIQPVNREFYPRALKYQTLWNATVIYASIQASRTFQAWCLVLQEIVMKVIRKFCPSWAQRPHVIWLFRQQASLIFQSFSCLFAWIIPTYPSLLHLEVTSSRKPFLMSRHPCKTGLSAPTLCFHTPCTWPMGALLSSMVFAPLLLCVTVKVWVP